jgi:hypothetical protein
VTCADSCTAIPPRPGGVAPSVGLSAGPALWVALLAALLGTSVTSPARGDEAADTAAARVLGLDGLALADQGKCGQAIEKLQRSETLHHAPSTATRLGECEIETGKLVAGTERLQRVVRESLPRGAPAAFVVAVARAQKALDRTLPRISILRIAIRSPAGAKPVITLDGEPLPDAVLLSDRPTDPGKHRIQATASGFLSSVVDVSLGDGESKSISLELQPDPSAQGPARERAPVHRDSSTGLRVAGFTTLGLGVAAVGLGAVAGALVATKSSSLSSTCDANRVCPESQQSDLNSAKTWATISNVGFIAGGTGIVSGLVMLLKSGHSAAPPSGEASLGLSIGATSIGLNGSF